MSSEAEQVDSVELENQLKEFELEFIYLYLKDNRLSADTSRKEHKGWLYIKDQRASGWEDGYSGIKSKLKNQNLYYWGSSVRNIEGMFKILGVKREEISHIQSLKKELGSLIAYKEPYGILGKYVDHINRHNKGLLETLVKGILEKVAMPLEGPIELTGDEPEAGEPETKKEATPDNPIQEKSKTSGKWWAWPLRVSLAFAFSLIGFILGRNQGDKDADSKIADLNGDLNRVRGERNKYKREANNTSSTNNQKTSRTSDSDELKLARDQIATLEEQLKEALNQQGSDQSQILNESITPSAGGSEKPEFVYLSSPTDDGKFPVTDETPQIEEWSYFEFKLKSENTAEFRFIDQPDIHKRAINTFSDRISTVCNELNTMGEGTQSIVTKKSGIAIREDGNWRMQEKADIVYS